MLQIYPNIFKLPGDPRRGRARRTVAELRERYRSRHRDPVPEPPLMLRKPEPVELPVQYRDAEVPTDPEEIAENELRMYRLFGREPQTELGQERLQSDILRRAQTRSLLSPIAGVGAFLQSAPMAGADEEARTRARVRGQNLRDFVNNRYGTTQEEFDRLSFPERLSVYGATMPPVIAASLINPALGAATASSIGMGEVAGAIEEQGGDISERPGAVLGGGAAIGALDAIVPMSLARTMRRIPGVPGMLAGVGDDPIINMGTRALTRGGTEMVTEGAQEQVPNLLTGQGFAPFGQTLEAMAAGGILGSTSSLAVDGTTGIIEGGRQSGVRRSIGELGFGLNARSGILDVLRAPGAVAEQVRRHGVLGTLVGEGTSGGAIDPESGEAVYRIEDPLTGKGPVMGGAGHRQYPFTAMVTGIPGPMHDFEYLREHGEPRSFGVIRDRLEKDAGGDYIFGFPNAPTMRRLADALGIKGADLEAAQYSIPQQLLELDVDPEKILRSTSGEQVLFPRGSIGDARILDIDTIRELGITDPDPAVRQTLAIDAFMERMNRREIPLDESGEVRWADFYAGGPYPVNPEDIRVEMENIEIGPDQQARLARLNEDRVARGDPPITEEQEKAFLAASNVRRNAGEQIRLDNLSADRLDRINAERAEAGHPPLQRSAARFFEKAGTADAGLEDYRASLRPRVQSPAWRIGGHVYTGPAHYQALEAAAEALQPGILEDLQGGDPDLYHEGLEAAVEALTGEKVDYDTQAGYTTDQGFKVGEAVDAPAQVAPPINAGAEAYLERAGIDAPPYVPAPEPDQAFHDRMAEAYLRAPHAPRDPEVRRAYEAFNRETEAQYRQMTEGDGIRVEFVQEDPYTSSAEMMRDVLENKTLRVFKGGEPHELMTGVIETPNGPETINNIFRAVHDYYGHAHGFAPFETLQGEEGAYRRHSTMYGPEARRAMAVETRGQTSTYYRTDGPREFPEQKATLLPEEFTGVTYPDESGEALFRAAAIKLPNGDILEGPFHQAALSQAVDESLISREARDNPAGFGITEGFVDRNGNFFDRAGAAELARTGGAATAENFSERGLLDESGEANFNAPRPHGAAVKILGQTFAGGTHVGAASEAVKAGLITEEQLEALFTPGEEGEALMEDFGYEQGFLDTDENFLTRKEARERWGSGEAIQLSSIMGTLPVEQERLAQQEAARTEAELVVGENPVGELRDRMAAVRAESHPQAIPILEAAEQRAIDLLAYGKPRDAALELTQALVDTMYGRELDSPASDAIVEWRDAILRISELRDPGYQTRQRQIRDIEGRLRMADRIMQDGLVDDPARFAEVTAQLQAELRRLQLEDAESGEAQFSGQMRGAAVKVNGEIVEAPTHIQAWDKATDESGPMPGHMYGGIIDSPRMDGPRTLRDFHTNTPYEVEEGFVDTDGNFFSRAESMRLTGHDVAEQMDFAPTQLTLGDKTLRFGINADGEAAPSMRGDPEAPVETADPHGMIAQWVEQGGAPPTPDQLKHNRPIAAAVEWEGEYGVGPIHVLAAEHLVLATHGLSDYEKGHRAILQDGTSGFLLADGSFITRDEAIDRFGAGETFALNRGEQFGVENEVPESVDEDFLLHLAADPMNTPAEMERLFRRRTYSTPQAADVARAAITAAEQAAVRGDVRAMAKAASYFFNALPGEAVGPAVEVKVAAGRLRDALFELAQMQDENGTAIFAAPEGPRGPGRQAFMDAYDPDREPGEVAKTIAANTLANGGGTLSIDGQEPPKKQRYMVGSHSVSVPLDGNEPHAVDAYIRANEVDLRKPGFYVGTFHNPESGMLDLDVTRPVSNRKLAEALTVENEQESFFDMQRFRTVRLWPQGEPIPDAVRDEYDEVVFYDPTDEGAAERRVLLDNNLEERAAEREEAFLNMIPPYVREEYEAANAGNKKRMLDEFSRYRPQVSDVAEIARLGAPAFGWYWRSAESIWSMVPPGDVDGIDPLRFSYVTAVFSPNAPVPENQTAALHFWLSWNAMGRPTNEETVGLLADAAAKYAGAVLPGYLYDSSGKVKIDQQGDPMRSAVLPNLMRVVNADPATMIEGMQNGFLSGLKVDAFGMNLVGDISRATMDTHMARGMNVSDPSTKARNYAMQAVLRGAARELGGNWTPPNVQETTWQVYRALSELSKRGKVSEVLFNEDGDLDIPTYELLLEMIATPSDFAAVLARPENERLLHELMRDYGWGAPPDPAGLTRYEPSTARRANPPTEALRRTAGRMDAFNENRRD